MNADRLRPRLPLWRLLILALLLAYALADIGLEAMRKDGAFRDLVPQWALAHLAATGHRAAAYDFDTQAALLKSSDVPLHHTFTLLGMPHVAGIGVCPYPPTFAVLYAPVCRLPFTQAGMVLYFVSVALALVAAWAIGRATNGRVSGLTAAVAILFYPEFEVVLHEGQNSLITLALWALGWREFVRGRDLLAGLWWGVLAYKIHWLLAVGWVPLVVGRPRALVGMAASAGALAVAGTALLGPDAWRQWAGQLVAVDRVFAYDPEFRATALTLAGDLRSVTNRYLSPGIGARVTGWALLTAVVAVTAIWYRRRSTQGPAGPAGAAVLFASGLTVPHLYFYDETVFMLPLLVLWSHRGALVGWRFVELIVLTAAFYLAPKAIFAVPWGPSGPPPLMTLAAVALWLLSLTVKTEGSVS
jgi:hypothetical protein